MKNDPTLIGTVEDVRGSTVSVALLPSILSGLTFIDGQGFRIGQIGSFVRIPMGYDDLFGVVSQVGAGAVPEKLIDIEPHGRRWMTIQIVGEGLCGGEFRRGISQYPTVSDPVHIVTGRDLSRIYGRRDAPNFVSVGNLASAESIPALVNIDKLLTRHSAVIGATGSGKSTTVAGLISSLTEKFASARILLLDIHGEYANALRDKAAIFRVNANLTKNEKPLFIPYWAMNFDEFMSVTLGQIDDTSRGAVLEKVTELKLHALGKQSRKGVSKDNLNVDTPVPFSIHKLWFDFHCLLNATHTVPGTAQTEQTIALLKDDEGKSIDEGDSLKVKPPKYKAQSQASGQEKIFLSASTLNMRKQLDGLASKLRDPRFDFLFKPGPWIPNEDGEVEKDLDLIIEQWIGDKLPVTILDLSGVPNSILTNLIGVLLRIVYDALFWARNLSEGGRERPLLIVLEEAHSYLNPNEIGSAAIAVKRIVKEGRKYGIGAMIVSQRPSEIDSTILSQCGTLFALRLSNSQDRSHVTGTVTDNLEGLLSMLPVLRTGEAIIIGESVHLPVRTLIELPAKGRRPDSSDPPVYDELGAGGWNRPKETSDYKEVVETWRRQDPTSPKEKKMKRIPVDSTNVASVGYDEATSTMEVEFTNGSVYQYFDVPKPVCDGLISAKSPGGYLHDNIKGYYRYTRV